MAVITNTVWEKTNGIAGSTFVKGTPATNKQVVQLQGVTKPTSEGDPEYDKLQQQLADYGERVNDLMLSGDQIKSDWEQTINDLNAKADEAQAVLSESYDYIKSEYEAGRVDSEDILKDMRTAMSTEVSKMANAYNNQAAREAERVDALVANGALGGNAYRAYQAHTQTNRDLMAQATGQIAAVTLQYTDSIATKAVQLAGINSSNYSATAAALASIAGKQADSMLGFSDLLVQANVNAETNLLNIYGLQLQTMAEQNKLYLANRQLNNELAINELNSVTQIETTRINNGYDSYWRGGFIDSETPSGI